MKYTTNNPVLPVWGCLEYAGLLGKVNFLNLGGGNCDRGLASITGSIEKLQALAREKGMQRLYDDGLRRAFAGDTSLEEVLRVAFAS